MAKTRSRTKSGQFTKTRSHSTALARSSPRTVTKYRTRTVVQKTRRRRGRSSGRRDVSGRIMHWGWALLAYDFAANAIGNKLPVLVDAAGPEGSLALAAHFLDADKYVSGIEDVSFILALEKYLKSTSMIKKPAEGGGFGL